MKNQANTNSTEQKPKDKVHIPLIVCGYITLILFCTAIVGVGMFAFIQVFRRDKKEFLRYDAVWYSEELIINGTGNGAYIATGTMIVDGKETAIVLDYSMAKRSNVITVYNSDMYNEMQAKTDATYKQDYGKLYDMSYKEDNIFDGCIKSVEVTIKTDYLAISGGATSRVGEKIKLLKQ